MFAGSLTDAEALAYANGRISDAYEFPEEFRDRSLADLIENEKFYLGLVGVYDADSVNITNCVMKYDGNTFSVSQK